MGTKITKQLQHAYDQATISKRLFFGMPTVEEVASGLSPGEETLLLLKGSMGGESMYKAVCVATDKGVHIFVRGYYTKLLKNNVSLIPYEQITNISYQKRLMFKYFIEIVTGGDTVFLELIEMEDAAKFVNLVKKKINLPKNVEVTRNSGSDSKVCPDCAESVKTAAKKCRYCGFSFL